MTRRSEQQRWILDTLLATGGFDVLHPGAEFVLTQFGYDSADFKRVIEPARAGIMVRDRFGRVAMEVEKKAEVKKPVLKKAVTKKAPAKKATAKKTAVKKPATKAKKKS